MEMNRWRILQLFAGEGAGDGGEGAATGETIADAGQRRLQELGVPASKIRERAKMSVGGLQSATAQRPAQTQGQAAAPQTETPAEEPEKPEQTGRMTWDEIMADPEYNREMQSTLQKRLRKAKGAETAMEQLAPALELLARHYKLEGDAIDYEALARKIGDDTGYYEQRAVEMGVDVSVAKQLDQLERNAARQQRVEAQLREEERVAQHLRGLEEQGEKLKKIFPSFDLNAELSNPAFVRMTAPGSGLTVEDAYYAIHRKEIQAAAMEATQRQTAEKMSRAIQSQQGRPNENGTSAQAPSVTTFDYRNASPAQREELKKRIRAAAARGEKLYPGQ